MADATNDGSISIAGYRANYTVARSEAGVVTVTNTLTNETSNYKGITLIKFFDQWTSFDVDGAPGQLYRLYQAAFNRKPDLGGLGFWINAAKAGVSMIDITGGFINSQEFRGMYGESPSNANYVDSLYRNVLHRAGEPGGFNWWLDVLTKGADRRGVLLGFAESAENKKNLHADVMNGFDYIPSGPSGPIIPKFSSYENKVAAAQILGQQRLPPEVASANAVAFGDFFQDGSYSMVTASLDYIPAWDPTKFGKIRFYKQVEGKWVDSTAQLLADNTGCIHPRKAVVADFNNDGKPDVLFACHGFDRDPFPGEQPRLLLSQKDGTYQNSLMPFTCFCHGATAVSKRNDGYADIVLTDSRGPFYLVNDRGSFTKDATILPTDLQSKSIFSVEAFDVDGDGVSELWFGGHEPGSDPSGLAHPWEYASQILYADSAGKFSRSVTLPIAPEYGANLDAVVIGGKLYMLRTNVNGKTYGVDYYSKAAIEEIDLATLKSSLVYTHSGYYTNGMTYLNWLIPVGRSVQIMDAGYGVVLQ